MNGNLQPKRDPHQFAVDLTGLEQLLESTDSPEATDAVAPAAISAEESEARTIIRLLEQLTTVTDMVKETRDKLFAANERMSTLTTMVTLQSKQLELLGHYQSQASRVVGLERQLAVLEAENDQLRNVWWRRLLGLFRRI